MTTRATELDINAIRRILEEESSSLLALLPVNAGQNDAVSVMQVLQAELDTTSHEDVDKRYRKKCLKYLRALIKRYYVLPPTLFVENIIREGDHAQGGGGFADIWKGLYNERPVCLKVLRMFTGSDEASREKAFMVLAFDLHISIEFLTSITEQDFCEEAILWKQLKHPNILPFLGVNTTLFAPGFCLVSPWMTNGDIVSFVKAFPNFDKLTLIYEISSALTYLHSLEPAIVHGDVKGANILITDDFRCCLADFGLAIAVETQIMSSSGGLKGSFRWLSPELLPAGAELPTPGHKRNKPSRDIYAFGCTILEVCNFLLKRDTSVHLRFKIITGRPPFADLAEGAVLLKVVQGERPGRPGSGWCPDSIWDLIEQCWEHDPRRRPHIREINEHLDSMIQRQRRAIEDTLMPRRPRQIEESRDHEDNPLLEFFPPTEWVKVQRRIDIRIIPWLCLHYLIINSCCTRPEFFKAKDLFSWPTTLCFLTVSILEPVLTLLTLKPRFIWVMSAPTLLTYSVAFLGYATFFNEDEKPSQILFTCTELLATTYLPCALYYLTFWFTPEELPMRIGIIYATGQAGKMIWPVWQLLEPKTETNPRAPHIHRLGTVLPPDVPESPQTAGFLNEEQRRYTMSRLPEHAPSMFSRRSMRTSIHACHNVLYQPLFWTFAFTWLSHAIPRSGLEFQLFRAFPSPSYLSIVLLAMCSASTPLALAFLVSVQGCNPFMLAIGLQIAHITIYMLQAVLDTNVWFIRQFLLPVTFSTAGALYVVLWPQRIKATSGTIGTGFTIALTDAFASAGSAILAPLLFAAPDNMHIWPWIVSIGFLLASMLSVALSGYLIRESDADEDTRTSEGVATIAKRLLLHCLFLPRRAAFIQTRARMWNRREQASVEHEETDALLRDHA
ncbi:hypothetical protein VNI00_000508 [Paramarasmius palmivorus]|uniref:Protein kinase domain-containing protein n=1 Tax=Paramarasmius palmivorus TaxID=297713 RepID=A0AAW0EB13_9AGAR